jgi:hypothetical protein
MQATHHDRSDHEALTNVALVTDLMVSSKYGVLALCSSWTPP